MDLTSISMRVAFGWEMDPELLRIAIRVLEAAKVDDLISANPDLEDSIRKLSEEDPSKKGKYLEWCVKQLKMKAKIEDMIPTIQAFHDNQQRLQKRDINQYKSLKELEDAIKDLPESKTKEKARVKSEGAKKLWENDTHALFRIETRDACVQYGKGTKWCITMKAHNYWESYKSGNNVFYFLIDKRQTEPEKESQTFSDVTVRDRDQYSKIAWAVRRSMEDNSIEDVTIFDSRDKRINKQTIPGIPEFSQINQMVIEDAPNAPDGPIVSMRKGKITPKDLYDYLSMLDRQTLLTNIGYVTPNEQLDPAIIEIVRKKQSDLSNEDISRILRSIKGGSPETDQSLLELAKKGVEVNLDTIRKGEIFDEILKARIEHDPDYLNKYENTKYIAKVTDVPFRNELAEKYKGRMAETGILADKETLEKLLNDEDPKVRRSAIKGLAKQPEMLEAAVTMVNDPDPSVREALAEISNWCWQKSGVPEEIRRGLFIKLLQDADSNVVKTAAKNDISKLDPELLKKIATHPDEKVRQAFQENHTIDSSLKPKNDESELVRESIIHRRKFSPEELSQMAQSEDVNERRLAIGYVKTNGYITNDHYSASGKKAVRDFANKLVKDKDPQVRFLANSALRIFGGKYDTEGFEKSSDSDDVNAWIGTNTERAKSVLETPPPNINSWHVDRVNDHAKNVLKSHELMNYLSGKTETFPKMDGMYDLFRATALLPKEFLPKLLEKLPIEGVSMTGVFEDLAKRMDKKYAREILGKIQNPSMAPTAITELFKKLDQSDIQKFMDSDSNVIRRAVARRIDKSKLPEMIDDADYEIRRIIADKIDPEHLPKMMKDHDPKVRRRVAERIAPEYLEQMRKDKSIRVRDIIKKRLGIASESSLRIFRISCVVADLQYGDLVAGF
jgi:hypothetical protein